MANDSVSLIAQPGRVFGLLGPNGAGKSTLIRMITNIIQPDSGTIELNGQPVNAMAQERIGYLPEERGLYKKLTVLNQITYFAQLKGLSASDSRERARYWLHRLDADGWENKKIQELSKGMQQKVQFISTILHQPSLVVLDEPFSGLDPVNVQLLINTVNELRATQAIVLLSTHQMEQVEKLCDDIALIHRGHVVLSGTVREVKSAYRTDRVLIEFQGTLPDLTSLSGVSIQAASEGRVELQISSEGVDTNTILQAFIASVHVTRFEVSEPTLHDIFVRIVDSPTGAAA